MSCLLLFVFSRRQCITSLSVSRIVRFFSKVPKQCRKSDVKLTLVKTCTAERITHTSRGNRHQQSFPRFNERKRGLNRDYPICFVFLKHLHKDISEHDICQKMLQTLMITVFSLIQNIKNGNSH